ncbi:MAG: cadmium-translocating P-type ATPase [Acidobacteria bacterium]|nr:MAG: cadmium-translocating P-type ATPase [Acidobacteriota bacterium]
MEDIKTTAWPDLGKEGWITLLALAAIVVHLILRFGFPQSRFIELPLWIGLAGAIPLLTDLAHNLWRREFGSDLLAGVSIVTAVILGELLVAVIVVLLLSGGALLERLASRRATAVLDALARRVPTQAHRLHNGDLQDVSVSEIAVGDHLIVFPHETCPVDGVVIEGQGSMDEAYLTGEPYQIAKAPGSTVISGAINGEAALTIETSRLAVDSRYASIVKVVEMSEQAQPRVRRIGDRLGAWYLPLAMAVAIVAALAGGGSERFLAVVVVATPCPLLIAIPVALIGGISLAARRGVVVRRPDMFEQVGDCRTLILDKTGTLTYGKPTLTSVLPASGFTESEVLAAAASLERFSRHPLAAPILAAAKQHDLQLLPVEEVSEKPGEGLRDRVNGREVLITGRGKLEVVPPELPPVAAGLECLVLLDRRYAGCLRFRDTPRPESRPFVGHLGARHGIDRVVLLSGDREAEVRYLADSVGIQEMHAGQSPEQKLAFVRHAVREAKTIFVGDGINDAPALLAVTVGIALGIRSDVTAEAADAVIMDASLRLVDELMHIARHSRRILLQSAIGGMALSLVGMGFAAVGLLSPIAGAIAQEVIDLLAVLNASRAALAPRRLTDF